MESVISFNNNYLILMDLKLSDLEAVQRRIQNSFILPFKMLLLVILVVIKLLAQRNI